MSGRMLALMFNAIAQVIVNHLPWEINFLNDPPNLVYLYIGAKTAKQNGQFLYFYLDLQISQTFICTWLKTLMYGKYQEKIWV